MRVSTMDWNQVQRDLWIKWRTSDPDMSDSELWAKYKHEWVEAYRPFVKVRGPMPRWLLFA
jgi:hypothetical protein